MRHLFSITLYGLVTGMAGTGLGGLSVFLFKRITNRILGTLMEYSGGLMTAVVCFELLPQAFELGNKASALTGMIAGIVTIIAMDILIRKSSFLKKGRNTGLLRAAVLMAIAIGLHNFPEGFAVGSGLEVSTKLGLTIITVIIIHDIPEGIAISVPMNIAGFSKWKSFAMAILSGLPTGIGAFFGAALSGISRHYVAACLGFAAGAMLYTVFGELLPESKRLYFGRLSSLGNVAGFLCGIILSICN